MQNFLYRLTIALLIVNLRFLCAAETTPATFDKAGPTELFNRPQEPTLPYPYDAEEVSFENASDGVRLAGTLTLPRTQGPYPVVVLLHGSAPFDRDSFIFGHKPFLVWADHLTKHGIAVLRFDKRSAGKSTGDYSTATLEDFANDALAAVEYLKSRKEINIRKIGLVGHSEGGVTASLAASKSNDVAFIVLMAAPCTNGEDLILEQEKMLQRIDGVPEEMTHKSQAFRKQVLALLKKEKHRAAAEEKLREIFAGYFSKLTLSETAIAEKYYGPKEAQIQFFNSSWFRYYLSYDPAAILKKIRIPVLALNGELDFVVSSEKNLKRIAKTFEEVRHSDYTILELPKLNHGFQTCQTGSMAECANIEETTSPLALKKMTDWILDRTIQRN